MTAAHKFVLTTKRVIIPLTWDGYSSKESYISFFPCLFVFVFSFFFFGIIISDFEHLRINLKNSMCIVHSPFQF